MTANHQADEVFARYRELVSYCDGFFARVMEKYPRQMACRAGCHACCELESVCALEATILYSAFDAPVRARRRSDGCVLLSRGRCRIYTRRPVICRTHGLALIDSSVKPPKANCCPLNFRSLPMESLGDDELLDEQRIAMNLMRLNLAFCTIIGAPELAGARFFINDVVSGKMPMALKRPSITVTPPRSPVDNAIWRVNGQ